VAIRPSDVYSAQTAADPNYPHGRARNDISPDDGTGTPLEETWLNDLWGFQQAALVDANVTPSGTPDRAAASQILQSILTLAATRVALANWLPTASASGRRLASNSSGTVIVAVGDDGIRRSTDGGMTWTLVESPITDAYFSSVVWDGARFVAVVTSPEDTIAILFYSTDGAAWTSGALIANLNVGEFEGEVVTSLAYGAGHYVVTTSVGRIFSLPSPEFGSDVIQRATGLQSQNGIAFGDFDGAPAFIAVSGTGGGWRYARPSDLDTWTSVPSVNSTVWWNNIHYASGGVWYGVSQNLTSVYCLNPSGTVSGFNVPGAWAPRGVTSFDGGRQVILVGQSGRIAYGPPHALQSRQIVTTHLRHALWVQNRAVIVGESSPMFVSFSR
jgi:hypothetical protein